jgi:cytochrome c oxidase subunit 2
VVLGSTLDPQGPAAESAADLWWLMLALGAVVFLVVVTLLLVGLFRRPPSAPPAGQAPKRFGRWIIGGGVVAPAVVLVVVFVATVAAMRDVEITAPDDALVIEIVGHRWWWEVRYPEAGVTTANEVHMPVGRQVAFELTSVDVIHSFWVPALGGKLDAMPDGVNTLVLQADEPGEHRSECAEFCGLQHAQMGLVVTAEPVDRFEAWLAEESRPAREPADASARSGRDVFHSAGCAGCHAVRGTGTGTEAGTGPDLTHLASRQFLGATAVPNTAVGLAEWVRDPHTIKDGVGMPATDISDEELDALLAYLETLE